MKCVSWKKYLFVKGHEVKRRFELFTLNWGQNKVYKQGYLTKQNEIILQVFPFVGKILAITQ